MQTGPERRPAGHGRGSKGGGEQLSTGEVGESISTKLMFGYANLQPIERLVKRETPMNGQTSRHVIRRTALPSGALLLLCALMMACANTLALGYGAGPFGGPLHAALHVSNQPRIAGRHVSRSAHAAAHRIAVKDTVSTHLLSQQGGTLINEQGAATGTLKCPVTMLLKLGLTEANITLTCKAKGGTLSGRGQSTFYVEGNVTHFNGTLSVTKSTGKYAHATADVHMRGTMQRGSFALAATLAGTLTTK